MSQAFDASTLKFPPDDLPYVHDWVFDGCPVPPHADATAVMKQVPYIMSDDKLSKPDSSVRYMTFDRLIMELKKAKHGSAAIRWGIHWLYCWGMLDFHFRDKQPPPSMSKIQKRKQAGLPVRVNGQYVPEVLAERSGPPEKERFVETTKRLWEWWRAGCPFVGEQARETSDSKPENQTSKPTRSPGRKRLADSGDSKARLTANLYANIRARKTQCGTSGKELVKQLKADAGIVELAAQAGRTIDVNLVRAADEDARRSSKGRTKSAARTK